MQLHTGGLLGTSDLRVRGVIKTCKSVEVVNHSIRLSLSSALHQKGFPQSRRGCNQSLWQVISSDTMATIGLGGVSSRTGPVSKAKQMPRSSDSPNGGDQRQGNSWSQTGWCQTGVCSVKGAGEPTYWLLASVFAWNKRSGLGECSGEMWALEGPSNSDMKNLLAFPSEKACLRTWRVNLSFFQQTVACKEDKTSSCYGLRYGPGLFKCFSSAGLVVGRGCPLGKPTTKWGCSGPSNRTSRMTWNMLTGNISKISEAC